MTWQPLPDNVPLDHETAPPASDAPAGYVPLPDNAPVDQPAPADTGFTDEQKQAIKDYIPKAKDAADLERYSLEISGGKSKVGNAQEVLDKLKNGAAPEAFAWADPTVSKNMARPQQPGPLEGAGRAFISHIANAAAADYGPEVGALIDKILDPSSDLSNNAEHERAILQGESTGHGVASTLGELTGAGLTAPLGGRAVGAVIEAVPVLADAAAAAPRTASAAEAAAGGAVYGSGAAGPGDRAEGAVGGAALGAATAAVAPLVAKFIAATKAGDTAAAAAVAKAAHDLGIDLPRFVAGSEADAQRASALEQTIAGRKPISDATNKMLDQSEAARSTIASGVGAAAEPAAMGDQALSGGVQQLKSNRARIGRLYDQARTAAGGTIFDASKTETTLQQLVDNENQVLGGTKAGAIFQNLLEDLRNRGGKLTIDGARDTRSELRTQLRDEAGVTPDNADRLTNMVMGSINGDIESGLIDKGQTAAIPLYRQADKQWAQQRTLEDDILKPFLGKDFGNWGEEVAKKINSDVKGNGTRLAQFLSALPEENANTVRASLIMHLGNASDGAQTAAGDAFSLDKFLTNWNQIKGARNLIFPKETVQSLDKLAHVAEAVKVAGRTKNRSNTGGVVSYFASNAPVILGSAESLLARDPRGVALGFLAQGLGALRQYGAARALASPEFARKLAATPMNKAGAVSFWSRPWVKQLQLKNPAIAGEIQAFQNAFLKAANDNSLSSAAAEPQEQNQQ